jgi:periplasmic protein TonB
MSELDDSGQGRAGRPAWVGRAAAILVGGGLLVAGAYAIYKLIGTAPAKKPGPQQIALIKQPPPPPPKPPEKPPEPQKIKEEVKIDEPKPVDKPPDQAPADDKPASDKPLGLDADGAAGSDGFGLAANKGGRDMLGTGTGGGGSGRYFTGLLQRNFFDALARNRNAPQSEFSVVVSIWLGEDGRVLRSQIVNSSGDPQIDSLIQNTLGEMPALREVPPASMRQVQLRLNRRA